MEYKINFEEMQKSTALLSDYFIHSQKFLNKDSYKEDLDYFTSKLLLDLIEGRDIKKNFVLKYIEKTNIDNTLKPIIKERWLGILDSLYNKFEDSEKHLRRALEIAKEKDIEKWLIRDIFIDIRYILSNRFNIGEKDKMDDIKQINDKLNNYSSFNYYPSLDRKLYNSINKLLNEYISEKTKNQSSRTISNKINQAMNDLSIAFIISINFGSLKYIHKTRKKTADLLYMYSGFYSNVNLISESLKLYSLENEFSRVKNLLKNDWKNISKKLINNLEDIIEFPTKYIDIKQNKVMKCLFINKLGPYIINKKHLLNIQKFLLKCTKAKIKFNKKYDIKRNSIKALKGIINRIDTEKVLSRLYSIFDDHHLVSDKILDLLNKVKWKEVDIKITQKFVKKLFNDRNKLIRSTKVYEFFLRVKNVHPSLLQDKDKKLIVEYKNDGNKSALLWYFSKYKYQYDDLNDILGYLINKIKKIIKKKILTNGVWEAIHYSR